jgi:hypothetical protein
MRDYPGRAKLLFSATADRSIESLRPFIGACNRLLHWHELQHYKALGYHYYDFGGCTFDKRLPDYSITQFKLSFGGKVAAEPTIFLAKNKRLRIILRSLAIFQTAIRGFPWPESWLKAVRTRPKLASLFR